LILGHSNNEFFASHKQSNSRNEVATMTQNSKIKLDAAKPTSSVRMTFGPQAELILERLDSDVVQVTLVARTSFGWEMLGRQMLSLEQLQDLPIVGSLQTQPQDPKPSTTFGKKR
jgi:hypothetical protein